ncbi:hypothetical protein [Nocardiopsis oceani]
MTAKEPPRTADRILALTPEWRTVDTSLRVLLVIHSVTAATRIADILPALHDPRVQLYCAQTSGAVFANGVQEYIRENGVRHLPWDQARKREFDLVVTASLGDNLHEINSPILRIPHGNGYNKRWKQEAGSRKQEAGSRKQEAGSRKQEAGSRKQEVFGLSDGTLKHEGRLVPSAIALSHNEQFDRLRQGCPDALPLAFLAGDPCYDRLLASAPRRLNYRDHLGLRPGQKLITVNSTWKTDSLFGSHPSLVPRLLARLPYDEYRLALVLHPNVWSSHSERQIEAWLDEALRSGLLLIPPDEGWRAAVTAADLVLSDHGSVSVYAAALGRPVLLSPGGRDAVDPDSALGRLYDAAQPFDPHAPFPPQFHQAEKLRDHTHETARAWVSSAPEQSLDLIRAEAYRIMGVDPPARTPALLAVPPPRVQSLGAASLWVDVTPMQDSLAVHRVPAAANTDGPGILVVSDAELDHRLAGAADAFTVAEEGLPADEELWSDTVFAHRPGARLTVVHSPAGARLRTREGALLRVAFENSLDDDHLAVCVLAERLVTADHPTTPAALAARSPLRIRISPERTLTVPFEVCTR